MFTPVSLDTIVTVKDSYPSGTNECSQFMFVPRIHFMFSVLDKSRIFMKVPRERSMSNLKASRLSRTVLIGFMNNELSLCIVLCHTNTDELLVVKTISKENSQGQ